VLGCVLITLRILRSVVIRVDKWSVDHPGRRAAVMAASGLLAAALVWAWWPSGQYQPVRASDRGTLGQLFSAHPDGPAGRLVITPGTHLAVAMIPVGGATKTHPALYFLPGAKNQRPTAILSHGGPTAAAFPFKLPAGPRPGDTQALAVNTTDGGVVYQIAYALVTVTGGAPVGQANTAYALADCKACTTVAVSFQLILIVGQSNTIAPIDAAGALNYQCPACTTTAIADQMVVTLKSQPSAQLSQELTAALTRLNAVSQLGANGTPDAVMALVTSVQDQIAAELAASGLLTNPPDTSTSSAGSSTSTAARDTTTSLPGTSSSSESTDTTSSTGTTVTTVPATSSTDTAPTDTSTTVGTTSTTSPTTDSTTSTTSTSPPST
jgi:putative peptide zinc metalloprotease protein